MVIPPASAPKNRRPLPHKCRSFRHNPPIQGHIQGQNYPLKESLKVFAYSNLRRSLPPRRRDVRRSVECLFHPNFSALHPTPLAIRHQLTKQQETSRALDTINTSGVFRDNGTTLISAGWTFELGFFSPENSSNRYVGIWYQNITVRTVVWVANRDNPLIDQSGTLKFGSGILVLVDGTNEVVWSTNTSRYVQNPVAQLLDSGNLVVKNANSDDNPENFIWQSFNYPTDTLLPGMKLGWNFATGLEVYLTSWNNRNDPASGEYICHCDPTGYPQNVLKHRTSVLPEIILQKDLLILSLLSRLKTEGRLALEAILRLE